MYLVFFVDRFLLSCVVGYLAPETPTKDRKLAHASSFRGSAGMSRASVVGRGSRTPAGGGRRAGPGGRGRDSQRPGCDPKGWTDLLAQTGPRLEGWTRGPIPPTGRLNPRLQWSIDEVTGHLVCQGTAATSGYAG